MESDRLVPVKFSEEEWQYLRNRAEHFETTVQQEAREAVRDALARARQRKL